MAVPVGFEFSSYPPALLRFYENSSEIRCCLGVPLVPVNAESP